ARASASRASSSAEAAARRARTCRGWTSGAPSPGRRSMEREDLLAALVARDMEHDCAGVGPSKVCVRVMSVAELPSRFGHFRIVAFWNNRDEKEHVAMVHGEIVGAARVPTRLHSECATGDVMGSLRCDCRDQLERALFRLGQVERGLLPYIRQDGPGDPPSNTRPR